jgi:hypothetical protein
VRYSGCISECIKELLGDYITFKARVKNMLGSGWIGIQKRVTGCEVKEP